MAFSKLATTRQLTTLVRDVMKGTACGLDGGHRMWSLSSSSTPFSRQSQLSAFSSSSFYSSSSSSSSFSSSSSSFPTISSPFISSRLLASPVSKGLGQWQTATGLTMSARLMATDSEAAVVKAKKKVTEITTEAQFRFVCQKVLKSLAEYVQKQDFSTKKLVKILRRLHLLSTCRFRDELPPEFVAFTFFLISQLVQGRATTDRLVEDMMAIYTPLISERINQFDAQTVAKVFWGYGDLGVPPEGEIMDQLCSHTVELVHNIEFHDAVNILVSFHKYTDLSPAGNFIDALAEHLISKIDEATPHYLARLLTAFHLLDSEPSAALVDAAGIQALKRIGEFDANSIASFIYAVGTLDYRPHNVSELFPALTDQLVATGVEELGPRLLSRLLSAMAYLEIAVPPTLIPAIHQRLTKTTANASPKIISELVVALGMAHVELSPELIDSYKSQLLKKAQRVKTGVAGHTLAGFARLKVPLEDSFVQFLHRRGQLSIAAADVSDLLALITGYTEQNLTVTPEDIQEVVWRCIECLSTESGDNIHTFFELYRRCKEYAGVDVSELYTVLKGVTDLDPDNPEEGLQNPTPNNDDEDTLAAKAIEELTKNPRTPETAEDYYDPPELYEYMEPERAGDDQQIDPPDFPEEEEEE